MPDATKPLEVTLVGDSLGRPPKVDLQFDVRIVNTSDQALWYVLPSLLTLSWTPPKGGVHTLVHSEMTGAGRAVRGTFLGTGGFHALHVPAGGRLTARKIRITLWEEEQPLAPIRLEVIVARGISIDGEPAESWFAVDPSAKQHEDFRERPVEFDEVERRSFHFERNN